MMASFDSQSMYENGKIFVGGLSWETTSESMRSYFAQFGNVTDSVVMKESDNKPRGFGFVTFEDHKSVEEVLAKKGSHIIDGKLVDPKPANPKGDPQPNVQVNKKIFLGGLSFDTDASGITDYFNGKGFHVSGVDLKMEKSHDDQVQKKRGFAFVEFETEEEMLEVVKMHYFMLDGKRVEAKKAEPKNAREKKLTNTPALNQYSAGHVVYNHSPMTYHQYPAATADTRFASSNGTPMYSAYHQQYSNTYGATDYAGSYSPANTGGPVYQNYGNGYSNRGYNSQQQMSNYGQDPAYSQSRSAGFSNAPSDSYSTSAGSYGYDHGYNYGDQPTNMYARMPSTAGIGPPQKRPGHGQGGPPPSGYAPYSTH